MNKNTFDIAFVKEEKKNLCDYLETINNMVKEGNFESLATYTEFLHESAIKLQAYETAKNIAFHD